MIEVLSSVILLHILLSRQVSLDIVLVLLGKGPC